MGADAMTPRQRVNARYFSYDEAQAALGRAVRTRVAGRRLPQGTRGMVLYARRAGAGYELGIQWALTPPPLAWTTLPRFPFLGLRRQPLVTWVRQDQYVRYLAEAEEVVEENINEEEDRS
jgi:hypothetical protein